MAGQVWGLVWGQGWSESVSTGVMEALRSPEARAGMWAQVRCGGTGVEFGVGSGVRSGVGMGKMWRVQRQTEVYRPSSLTPFTFHSLHPLAPSKWPCVRPLQLFAPASCYSKVCKAAKWDELYGEDEMEPYYRAAQQVRSEMWGQRN